MDWKLIKEKLTRARRFAMHDVWDVDVGSLSALRSLGVRALRVLHLVLRGFREDECPLHAASLTFSTLMAIVPILALSLSLARVFDGDELARRKIHEGIRAFTDRFEVEQSDTAEPVPPEDPAAPPGEKAEPVPPPDPAADSAKKVEPGDGVLTPEKLEKKLNDMVESGFDQVEKINFTTLGGIGLILLLWMAVAVLGRVESSFNRVWGVTVGRSMWRKCTDYTWVVIIMPFLVTMASSFRVADIVSRFMDEATALEVRAFLDSAMLKNVTVMLMTSLTFTFIIMFMPNTKVRKGPGLAGGVVAALLFIIWLWLCATIQVGVAKYSKFYGSFAIVPIVLAWVYVSWQIVLFGTEVAFAVQNCATYRMEQGARRANTRARMLLALSVLVEAGRAMAGKRPRFEVAAYAGDNRVSVRFINDVVDELVNAGLLAELSEDQGSFVLLKAPSALTVQDVMGVILRSGIKPVDLGLDRVDPMVEGAMRKAEEGVAGSVGGMTIADLFAEEGEKG
ncbi:YihY/virulence factor BrkB family protein [Verrucomicrobiota bacterium]